jgi:branched-chain amino acid transport system substrate-binding protein
MKHRTLLTRVGSGATALAIAMLGFVGLSSTPSGAATKAPIPVGYICSCTGALASSITVNRQAYEAYVSYTNAHGGIDGHQIKLYTADDSLNPATASAEVHTFVTQDHIVALASVSNFPQAFDTYIVSMGIPVLGTDGSAEDMYTNPDFFFPGQTDDSLPAAVVLAAKKVHAKSFAIFYCAESPACQELVAPEKAAATKYGETLSYITQISASAPSFAAQCLAAKQAGATVLFIADAVSVVESVATSCAAQGYAPTIVASDGAVGEQFPQTTGLKSGLLAFEPQIPFNVTSTPPTKTMVAAFKKYQPTLMSNPNYNGEVDEAWVSGLLLTAAVEKDGNPAATVTSKAILTGLHSFKGVTLGGMAPPLTYHAGKANTTDCWFWMGTKNGKFTEPYGLKPECVPGS